LEQIREHAHRKEIRKKKGCHFPVNLNHNKKEGGGPGEKGVGGSLSGGGKRERLVPFLISRGGKVIIYPKARTPERKKVAKSNLTVQKNFPWAKEGTSTVKVPSCSKEKGRPRGYGVKIVLELLLATLERKKGEEEIYPR